MVKEHPIIFSAPMIRAQQEGCKTHTRRVMKSQPIFRSDWGTMGYEWKDKAFTAGEFRQKMVQFCPYGTIGDRLWVREAFLLPKEWDDTPLNEIPLPQGLREIRYIADMFGTTSFDGRVHPSIHMPRWASRITLEIVKIWIERLQEITYEDILAEGWDVKTSMPFTDRTAGEDARDWYRNLWNELYIPRGYGWDTNPFVWGIEFKEERRIR